MLLFKKTNCERIDGQAILPMFEEGKYMLNNKRGMFNERIYNHLLGHVNLFFNRIPVLSISVEKENFAF